MRLERRARPSRALQVGAPFVAVAFTLLVTSLLVAWAGAPVGRAYALLPKSFLTRQPRHDLLIFRLVTKRIKCFISRNHGSIGKAFLNCCA